MMVTIGFLFGAGFLIGWCYDEMRRLQHTRRYFCYQCEALVEEGHRHE